MLLMNKAINVINSTCVRFFLILKMKNYSYNHVFEHDMY